MLQMIFIYATNENNYFYMKGILVMDLKSIFTDLVDLAKAGYKPSDVKELLGMMRETKTEPETEPETKPETKTEPTKVVDAFEELIKKEV